MDKSKTKYLWIGAGIIALSVVGYFLLNQNSGQKPVIVFNDNIQFKVGQTSIEDEETEKDPSLLITPESIVNTAESRFDELSFNKIGCGNEPMTLEFKFLNMEPGSHMGTVYAKLGDQCENFTFSYSVVE